MAVFNFCYDLMTSLLVFLLLSLKLLSLGYLGVFDFLLKRPCVYLSSFDVLSNLSYAWGLTNTYRTLQLVYNFFLGSFMIPSMLSIRILFEFLYISIYLSIYLLVSGLTVIPHCRNFRLESWFHSCITICIYQQSY